MGVGDQHIAHLHVEDVGGDCETEDSNDKDDRQHGEKFAARGNKQLCSERIHSNFHSLTTLLFVINSHTSNTHMQ